MGVRMSPGSSVPGPQVGGGNIVCPGVGEGGMVAVFLGRLVSDAVGLGVNVGSGGFPGPGAFA